MNNSKKNIVLLKKIIFITIIIVAILTASVIAGSVNLNSVKIKFSNKHEITVTTSKTKVEDILKDNHIILEENERVKPGLQEEITEENKIVIYYVGQEEQIATEFRDKVLEIEEIVDDYTNITEKIETVNEQIPFETITKDASNGSTLTTNTIIQYGQNGLREVTYKIRYKNNIEIEKIELSSKIIKEPVTKIVQVQTKTVTSRGSVSRTSGTSGQSGVYKVTAYCPCVICCGKTDGITASGTQATANRTIAAPKTFAFGTQVVINGITYTVEDRGGAIQGNRIDVYMDTHQQALQWGVRYLEVEVLI